MTDSSLHVRRLHLHSENYPNRTDYPFNLRAFQQPQAIELTAAVTFFIGENGTGKSTLLQAVTRRCGIYIWNADHQRRFAFNPYEARFHQYLSIDWTDGAVPGAYFGSDLFQNFARLLDEWAATDPGQLDYFGGRSLTTLSHGQSLMAFFRSRCRSRGIFLLDEPETALSPRSQLELLNILATAGGTTQSQFIIATHSPLLLACPGAAILTFDGERIQPISYEETELFRIYQKFMRDPEAFLRTHQF